VTTTRGHDKDRQREDLARALDKPIAERRWGMFIDPEACTGCRACMVACKAENNTPPGVSYIVVIEEVQGTFPTTKRHFMPKPCFHCEHPSCVLVCPVEATWQSEDGTVAMDYMKCIGCRYCITACPYGARYFDFGDSYADGCEQEVAYEARPSPEYSRAWEREGHLSPIGNVRKCHHCQHRLRRGSIPACVESCPTDAIVFGDLHDPNSLVSTLIATHHTHRLKEELGNEPTVYYRG
jgi:Fe-S-cluster-containing dehydrogenase component